MIKKSIKSRWNSFDAKFKKEIIILIFIFIATAIFDMGSTFLGTNKDINIFLQKEGNPFAKLFVTKSDSIIFGLILSKIVGNLILFCAGFMLIGGFFRVISKEIRHPSFFEPFITSSLLMVSIANFLPGLTWYDIKIGYVFWEYPQLAIVLLSLLFPIEYFRWQKTNLDLR